MLGFGKLVRDKVTGFLGIATSKCEYLYGCTQWFVVPEMTKDSNKLEQGEWFDEGRLAVYGKGIFQQITPKADEIILELGKHAQDIVTTFSGIIVGRCTDMSCTTTYGISPPSMNGKANKTEWFTVDRIKILGKGVTKEEVAGEKDGGPNRDAPRF